MLHIRIEHLSCLKVATIFVYICSTRISKFLTVRLYKGFRLLLQTNYIYVLSYCSAPISSMPMLPDKPPQPSVRFLKSHVFWYIKCDAKLGILDKPSPDDTVLKLSILSLEHTQKSHFPGFGLPSSTYVFSNNSILAVKHLVGMDPHD